jgi:hypothetical protein
MRPIKINNQITIDLLDGEPTVQTKSELHPAEIILAVQNCVRERHPRIADVESWLEAYEARHPEARPPRRRPVLKDMAADLKWIEQTVKYYRKRFHWSEHFSKKIIASMCPGLRDLIEGDNQ